MARFTRREGLQLMLGTAVSGLLAAAGCQGRPAPAPHDGSIVPTERPPGAGRVGAQRSFSFITSSNPPLDHTGVAERPGYSPSDPRSASIIDPMSRIELFRVGGNFNSTVFINGTTDSGLVFPHVLRGTNSATSQGCWNSDGSLLMIDRYYEESGDPGNSAKSYLIDVTGTRGASAPWRIIRASADPNLGDGVGRWWFWDYLNPLRAYVLRDDGRVDEWWPIGGADHAVGEINNLYGPVSGFTGFTTGSGRHNLFASHDGVYHVRQCQRVSDQRWGGMKINLHTGSLGPFLPTPDTESNIHPDPDRGSRGTSNSGLYTAFSADGARHRFYNTDTGALVSDTASVDSIGVAHGDYARINGVDYYVGGRSSSASEGVRFWNIAAGGYTTKFAVPASNPQHVSCRGATDKFETYGAAGGATSGLRYAFWTRSNPSRGHNRGIWGIRLGPNDTNIVRYICNHRGVRASNRSECHPQQSPDGLKVCFPSNWQEPGVVSDSDVHPYVALIPEAWHNPNNDGFHKSG